MEAKELKRQIAALEQQPKLTPEDAEILKGLRAQREAANAPKEPDFLEDPRGYVDAKEKRIAEGLKKLEEANTRRESIETQQRELQGILQTTAGHEQEFVKTSPDYYQAIDHMRNVRAQQLAIWYPQASPQEIQRQIANEEISGAAQALRAGLNPAQAAYNYAKTFGYAPKPANGAAPAAGAAPANGAAPPEITKEAARTLGGTGGDVEAQGEEENPGMPELAAALAERFGARKRK